MTGQLSLSMDPLPYQANPWSHGIRWDYELLNGTTYQGCDGHETEYRFRFSFLLHHGQNNQPVVVLLS
jgi:hypothetical protein